MLTKKLCSSGIVMRSVEMHQHPDRKTYRSDKDQNDRYEEKCQQRYIFSRHATPTPLRKAFRAEQTPAMLSPHGRENRDGFARQGKYPKRPPRFAPWATMIRLPPPAVMERREEQSLRRISCGSNRLMVYLQKRIVVNGQTNEYNAAEISRVHGVPEKMFCLIQW